MQGRFQEACAEYECALAEDGANREAKVLLEMAVKAFVYNVARALFVRYTV